MKPLGVIDYGGGNVRSVINACQSLGEDPVLVKRASDLDSVSRVIFPGQGSFQQCKRQLVEAGLLEPLQEWIAKDRPFFGICVGYQLLFEGSEEAPDESGLQVLSGQVCRFSDGTGLKIPHMGWNALVLKNPEDVMWEGLGREPYFYFVHSYAPFQAQSESVAALTNYGETFVSAIRRGQVWGSQFHPEKSQQAGLQLLKNFLMHTG